jgi:hypothetical protein
VKILEIQNYKIVNKTPKWNTPNFFILFPASLEIVYGPHAKKPQETTLEHV